MVQNAFYESILLNIEQFREFLILILQKTNSSNSNQSLCFQVFFSMNLFKNLVY